MDEYEYGRGVRIPRPEEARPDHSYHTRGPAVDTSGVYRPSHRSQDPYVDPKEPYGGEGSQRGIDHGWANCTMASGATVFAYHTKGANTPWGGDLRHHQDDQEGGTDLYDLKTAWKRYGGATLEVWSGQGWDDVVRAHENKRAIVIDGSGTPPGDGDFTGAHACAIGIETRQSDGFWLFSDPVCYEWQWCDPWRIRTWAEHLDPRILFAVSQKVVSEPPPEPEPTPPEPEPEPEPEPTYSEGWDAGYQAGVERSAQAFEVGHRRGTQETEARVFASWNPDEPRLWPLSILMGTRWDADAWGQSEWVAPWPAPLLAVKHSGQRPTLYDTHEWTAAVWE